jgi:APA family basic amino acid/polyamine antiporter
MARKIPGLSRVLGTSSIASVAYGEIASSIYFALGIIALHALGFTPWVLLAVGLLFLLVALSYAEGTAAIPETGGAATFVRRAFNDPAGFLTGWALLLDYLIVMGLAALFATQYFAKTVGWDGLEQKPWDVVAAVVLMLAIAGIRLLRRAAIYRIAILVAVAAFASHVVIILLGFVYLFSAHAIRVGVNLGVAPTWSSIAFALPLAMLAYTGLETVANLAEETREPGRTLPRSLFAGIGAAVVVSFAIGLIGISAYPAHPVPGHPDHWTTELGTTWLRAPILGIVDALHGHIPDTAVDVLRVVLGVTGTIILIAALTTSISGAGRLARSLGQHDMLPHGFGVRNRRTGVAPVSIVSATVIASALLIIGDAVGNEVNFLASLYSFGILIAFTAAQVAVIKLRFKEPGLERPFRVPGNVTLRGVPVPVAALVGAPLTFAIWVAALATHGATRVAGPVWLLIGAGVFALVRYTRGEGLMEQVKPAMGDLVEAPEGVYQRILVPMKLGPIGEEVLATAIKLAEERGGSILALHVIAVPLNLPLDAELRDEEQRAAASLEEARTLASEHGVVVETAVVRARALGEAIVRDAERWEADLIVMGSAPRWRRQSRFFSPTVDYVLRRAASEVMVVAYPQGVLEEDLEPVS